MFLIVVGIDTASRYFGKERPFTKGLYKKSLSGRIVSITWYKTSVTVQLDGTDSSYLFLPGRDPVRKGLVFRRIVANGDSLWKMPMSDTVYTLGKKGIIYRWPFLTHDKFGRSYLEEELRE